MKPEQETALDAVISRVARGVPFGREFMASEIRPFIEGAAALRADNVRLAEHGLRLAEEVERLQAQLAERERLDREAMAVHS